MPTGRCFRDRRRTARRKDRQNAAVRAIKLRSPHSHVMTKFGPAPISFLVMDQQSKQRIVEDYVTMIASGSPRRAIRW